MAGFKWYGSLVPGEQPLLYPFTAKNAAVFSRGEMCTHESGEADAGASGDTAFIGIANEDVDNSNDGETVECIINPNAIYSVEDNNARSVGDLLDLDANGTGVTSPSNNDFMVIYDSADDELTHVIFNGNHFTPAY